MRRLLNYQRRAVTVHTALTQCHRLRHRRRRQQLAQSRLVHIPPAFPPPERIVPGRLHQSVRRSTQHRVPSPARRQHDQRDVRRPPTRNRGSYPSLRTPNLRQFLGHSCPTHALLRQPASRHQFDHIRSHFNLPGTYRLTLDVDNPDTGRIRVNSILIDPATPGVRQVSYPWTGRYFHSVPVELEAIPDPGYRFARWISEDLDTLDDSTLSVLPQVSHPSAQTVTLTAVFEQAPPDPEWVTFRTWMKQRGFSDADLDDPLLGAPGADPDLDGYPNLLEYALDGDPLAPHTATAPRIEVGESSVIMLFPQHPAKSDLAWIVQASTDLVNWNQIVYDSRHAPALSPADPIARIDLDTFEPSLDQLQRFFRLQIFQLDP